MLDVAYACAFMPVHEDSWVLVINREDAFVFKVDYEDSKIFMIDDAIAEILMTKHED